LTIGAHTFVNEGVSMVAHLSISVGSYCLIGAFATVFDTDHHQTDHHQLDSATPIRTAPVVIEDNVWVGRGAVILPGVRVGANSVIAANSVVMRDVMCNVLAAGSPARVVRELTVVPGWRRP
jgi:acetyltransferase-like isoleucine patch superfamily enzyme